MLLLIGNYIDRDYICYLNSDYKETTYECIDRNVDKKYVYGIEKYVYAITTYTKDKASTIRAIVST